MQEKQPMQLIKLIRILPYPQLDMDGVRVHGMQAHGELRVQD